MLEKKTEKVDLRIEPTLKWKLDELAKDIEVSVSVLVRRLIREGINELDPTDCEHQIPDSSGISQCFFNYDFPGVCNLELCPKKIREVRK